MRIINWYLRPPKHVSRSRAPMAQYTCIAGEVYGHALHRNGKRITTSPIVRVEGREFWTASGSHYVLDGEPLPEHLSWLNRCRVVYSQEQPLAVALQVRYLP